MTNDSENSLRTPAPVFQEVGYAHELVHAFAALNLTVKHAARILEKPVEDVWAYQWEELREYLDAVGIEVAAQQYDAMNLVASRCPELIANLSRPRFERLSPSNLLAAFLPPYETKARKRDITVRLDQHTCPKIPPIELEIYSMRRVFHNVLTNAIKYSYSGSMDQHRERFIRIDTKIHDPSIESWRISFQNYGIGITKQELSRVFEPGYRGELARRDNTYGSGLGLGEARKCMRLHGGDIRLRSMVAAEDVYLTTVSLIFPKVTNVKENFKTTAAVGRS